MARRRRDDNGPLIEAIVKLVGLVILASLFLPPVRNFLIGLGLILFIAFVVVGVVVLVVVIFKDVQKRRNAEYGPVRYINFDEPSDPTPSKSRVDCPPLEIQRTTEASGTTEISEDVAPWEIESLTTAKIIERMRMIDWYQFEKLVGLIYEKRGFQVTRKGGANADGGIDLIVDSGNWRAAVQCKQWKTWNVGVKAVREFLGALTDSQIEHGIFITLNGYTGDAKQLAEKHSIEIINESDLARMMDDANIQNDSRVQEILKDTRKFCPKCERLLVERVARKGPSRGEKFWGCSGYPRCHFKMPMST